MLPTGSLEFLFDRKAVIQFEQREGMDLGEIELELIDHGLEEMESSGTTVYLYGSYTDFGSLSQGCEQLGVEIARAGLQRVANNPQEFSEEQLAEIEAVIDKLEDDEDVQAVFTNVV